MRVKSTRERASLLLSALSGCVPELQRPTEALVRRVWTRSRGEPKAFAKGLGVSRWTVQRMQLRHPDLFL